MTNPPRRRPGIRQKGHTMEKHLEYLRAVTDHIDAIFRSTSGARCACQLMDETYIAALKYPTLTRDNHGAMLRPGSLYMVITCANGYAYYVDVTGDSILTACAEVMTFASSKL